MHTDTRTHTHTHTHTHARAHTHTHTHTHSHTAHAYTHAHTHAHTHRHVLCPFLGCSVSSVVDVLQERNIDMVHGHFAKQIVSFPSTVTVWYQVIHFAAYAFAGESVEHPLMYSPSHQPTFAHTTILDVPLVRASNAPFSYRHLPSRARVDERYFDNVAASTMVPSARFPHTAPRSRGTPSPARRS